VTEIFWPDAIETEPPLPPVFPPWADMVKLFAPVPIETLLPDPVLVMETVPPLPPVPTVVE
jgi:hypothetical protein